MNDLVESLRYHAEKAECGDTNVNEDLHDAADLIEQLQQRNTELDEALELVKQQRDSYRHERTALAILNEKLKKERDELVAHVERLREWVSDMDEPVAHGNWSGPGLMQRFEWKLNEIPQQSLNALKREAIIEAINNAKSKEKYSLPLVETTELYEYANTKYPTEGE